jgi:hypothetical protein
MLRTLSAPWPDAAHNHSGPAAPLRELIAAVVVHPDGKDEPRIEVRGRLAQLTGAPELFPQQKIPPTVVAGARYIRQKRAIEGEFVFAA